MPNFPFTTVENLQTTSSVFDNLAFASAIRRKMRDTATSFSRLELQTKLNRATLCRAAQGQSISLETYLRICFWIENPTKTQT